MFNVLPSLKPSHSCLV